MGRVPTGTWKVPRGGPWKGHSSLQWSGVEGEFLIVSSGGWDLGRLSVPLSVWRFQTLVVNVDQFQGCV